MIYFVGIERDITKEKEIDRAKSEFVSLASHQLRTPATGVKQFISMLLEGYAGNLTTEQEEFVRDAYESNERQLRIIEDLLETARIEAGTLTINPSLFDLINLLDGVILEQKMIFDDKKQMINFIRDSNPIMVNADKDKIRMVIDNLVNNANKYTPVGGKVTIKVKEDDENVTISIIDNGIGISEEDQKGLFVRFDRIQNKEAQNIAGTGLGLYIAKKIIDLHRGRIEINSKVDKGTRFDIILPRKRSKNGQKNSHS